MGSAGEELYAENLTMWKKTPDNSEPAAPSLFSGYRFAAIKDNELHLSKSGAPDLKLERTFFQIIAETKNFTAATVAEFDYSFTSEEPEPGPASYELARVIHGPISLSNNDTLCGFKDGHFLGLARKHSIYIRSGEENAATFCFWEASERHPEHETFFNVTLTEEVFSKTFGAAWINAGPKKVRIVMGVLGYQFGPERAFNEPEWANNFVVEAKQQAAQFRSIYLDIHNRPSPS